MSPSAQYCLLEDVVVYLLTYIICSKQYVGSTITALEPDIYIYIYIYIYTHINMNIKRFSGSPQKYKDDLMRQNGSFVSIQTFLSFLTSSPSFISTNLVISCTLLSQCTIGSKDKTYQDSPFNF